MAWDDNLYGEKIARKLRELEDMINQYPELAEKHQKAADDYKAGKLSEAEWKEIDNEFHMIRKLMGS